jgi:Undecaprenyl-phosphate galactose phosphotransferase WbaP
MPTKKSDARIRTKAAPLPWRTVSPRATVLALVTADVLAWLISVVIVFIVRTIIWGPLPLFWALYVTGTTWIVFRAASGLYLPFGISQPEELRRACQTTMAAGIVHLAMLVALGELQGWRLAGLGVWPLVIPIAYFLRSLAKLLLIRRRLYGNPYVVIGTGEGARRIVREMRANPEMGLIPVAAFGGDGELRNGRLEDVPVLGPVEDAERYQFPYPARHAILALGHGEAGAGDLALGHGEAGAGDVVGLATRLARSYPSIQVLTNLGGLTNLWVQPRLIGPYLMLETRHARFSPQQRLVKRVFDLLIAVPACVVAAPIVGIAALLVKVADPGPAFFSQVREGRNGMPIRIWKVRTMVRDAEKRLTEYLANDPAARFEYERTLKLRQDPRVIPRVGRFLRRASIDELPQLWNVLKGELSLVGPRVMLGHEVARFSEVGRELRRDVPPGLTGLWQVLYRNNSDLQIWELADSYYVHNWSVWLDGWILLRTVRVVLTGAGAY